MQRVRAASAKLVGLGLQAKFKILLSFYQVVATLNTVYGVELHESLSGWASAIEDYLAVDLFGIAYPGACLGSMLLRRERRTITLNEP